VTGPEFGRQVSRKMVMSNMPRPSAADIVAMEEKIGAAAVSVAEHRARVGMLPADPEQMPSFDVEALELDLEQALARLEEAEAIVQRLREYADKIRELADKPLPDGVTGKKWYRETARVHAELLEVLGEAEGES